MARKSLVSFLAVARLGVGVAAPGPTPVGHLALPPVKYRGIRTRALCTAVTPAWKRLDAPRRSAT